MTSKELRSIFLDFFKARNHRIVPSSRIIPQNDPTLLFTNAGMNQFKDIFLGLERPSFRRAVSVQKCMRASGKHNDLEDVGRDGKHHTFFEMLGNWSFGDYYKREAIEWAWEFVTGPLNISPEHIWVSVYSSDEEAYSLWKDLIGVPERRIARLGNMEAGDEENFWSMGDTGPCGPCAEIYYDYSPREGKTLEEGESSGDIIELWNLVFMEFNRGADGSLTPLPEKHVDTGMGLERTLAVLQGVRSNYETDLFLPLIAGVEEIAGVRCSMDNIVSFRVIADHIRGLVFTIADGAIPSNEGRGYVLRRILRRAVRHGKVLGVNRPFLYRLVQTIVKLMGDVYPEISERQAVVERVLYSEEELFRRTLDRGIEEFESTITKLIETGKRVFPGEEAFVLHDTYGFPYDLTEIMAAERGYRVDREGFEREMEAQRERAKKGAKFRFVYDREAELSWNRLREIDKTEFTGYRELVQVGMRLVRYRSEGEVFELVFDKTPFYGEAGGQVGDRGYIEGNGIRILVEDVKRSGGLFIHIGKVEQGEIEDIPYTGKVDEERRRRIMSNHTATHLLHYALRRVVGIHAVQAGSLVAPERLRFDFNHYEQLSESQLDEIESIVNSAVLKNIPVEVIEDVSFSEAVSMGAVALFGEKYGDRVRVVKIGDLSIELCGGTHVSRTGEIGLFKILREGSISSGVRRIEAVTNIDSFHLFKHYERLLKEVSSLLNTDVESISCRIEDLKDELRELKRSLKDDRRKKTGEVIRGEDDFIPAGKYRVALFKLSGVSAEEMREFSDRAREKVKNGVLLITSFKDGKLSIQLSAGDEAVKGGFHAGRVLQGLLTEFGGSGGGKPHLAQGGGIKPEDVEGLFKRLVQFLESAK
ncbi:MAG: alanine--tRNA ligase [Spirochaetota bacterium]